MERRLRVAAYGICVRDDEVLLARFVGGDRPRWTLPGGGMDHGEDPYRTVLRELTEETGYTGEVRELLGIHSWHDIRPSRNGLPDGMSRDYQGLRIIYSVQITGGELTHEQDGSTDRAEWFPLDRVPELERVALVDYGLDFFRDRPADGHPRREHREP